ncbi:50S ribosomal protein L29 [Candidatus Woesebacteria bacterium]|nr:50S ribosomal protein L29 [Candidatus Woesebacteria bacterium]
MKKKELTIFRKKEVQDLVKILEEKRVEARGALSRLGPGQGKNTKEYRNLRREIAQILTIIREKEIITNSNLLLGKEGSAKKK